MSLIRLIDEENVSANAHMTFKFEEIHRATSETMRGEGHASYHPWCFNEGGAELTAENDEAMLNQQSLSLQMALWIDSNPNLKRFDLCRLEFAFSDNEKNELLLIPNGHWEDEEGGNIFHYKEKGLVKQYGLNEEKELPYDVISLGFGITAINWLGWKWHQKGEADLASQLSVRFQKLRTQVYTYYGHPSLKENMNDLSWMID